MPSLARCCGLTNPAPSPHADDPLRIKGAGLPHFNPQDPYAYRRFLEERARNATKPRVVPTVPRAGQLPAPADNTETECERRCEAEVPEPSATRRQQRSQEQGQQPPRAAAVADCVQACLVDSVPAEPEAEPEFPHGDLVVTLLIAVPERIGNGTDQWKREFRAAEP